MDGIQPYPEDVLPREDTYEALYSKDKRRKKKRWTDGIVKVKITKDNSQKNTKKVIVFDEDGKRQITHSFIKLTPPSFQIETYFEFETEKYIVQILNIIKTNSTEAALQRENYNSDNKTDIHNHPNYKVPLRATTVGLRRSAKPLLSRGNKSPPLAQHFKPPTTNVRTQHYEQQEKQLSSWKSVGLLYTRDEFKTVLQNCLNKTSEKDNDERNHNDHIKSINHSNSFSNDNNNNNRLIASNKARTKSNQSRKNHANNKLGRLNIQRSLMGSQHSNNDSSTGNYKHSLSQLVNDNGYRNFLSNFSYMKILTAASVRANWRNDSDIHSSKTSSVRCTPASFSSIQEYLFNMEELIHQEIIIGLQDASKHFWEAAKRLQNVGDHENPFCECVKPAKIRSVVHMVRKEGKNKGKMFYSCSRPKKKGGCGYFKWCTTSSKFNTSSNKRHNSKSNNGYNTKFNSPIQNEMNEITQMTSFLSGKLKQDPHKLSNMFRSSGISFYANCKLVRRRPAKNMKEHVKATYYFKCSNTSLCEGNNRAKQGDLWVLTRSMNFSSCCIMRSTFHGFTSDGTMQLTALPECKPFYVSMNEEITVHAVRVMNCTSEFEMLDNINNLLTNHKNIPILKSLSMVGGNGNANSDKNIKLGNDRDEFTLSFTKKELHVIAKGIKDKFALNEDQNKVLQTMALKWFKTIDYNNNTDSMMLSDNEDDIELSSSCDDIILVHGCFGTGKSYMMVALIHFIVKVIEMEELVSSQNCNIRLLVACSTNVAVDRVLKSLHESGYTDFDRVGVSQSVEKSLRKYVQKTATSNIVVGSTLASCTSQAMQGQTFQIVFLDECSQQIEPSSLMSMGFGCKRALLVGDPLQLPPVCKYSTIVDSDNNRNKNDADFSYISGIDRAMFVRLQNNVAVKKIMLRIQYRLHPTLSQIPNELFYENMLQNGVTHKDREPLVPLTALVAYDCRKGYDQKDRVSNSYSNDYEAKVIVKLLKHLINDGVSEKDIGIICLYKAQAEKIQGMLGQANNNNVNNHYRGTDINKTDFVLSTVSVSRKKISNREQAKADRRMKTLIKVSTVDAFQGAEREVIILSTVRSTVPKAKDNESFISSKTRMCVALSRGKRHLFVVGDLHMLKRTNIWSTVIQRIDESGRIFSTDEVDGFLKSPIPVPKLKETAKDHTNGVAEEKIKKKRKINNSNDISRKDHYKKKKTKKPSNSLIDDEAEEACSDEEESDIENELNKTFVVDDDGGDDDGASLVSDGEEEMMRIVPL
jgi:hypothetical protein